MLDKMKQFMDMKKQADRMKKELDSILLDVEDIPGIKIKISGSQEVQAIDIEEKHLDPNNKVRFERNLVKGLKAATRASQRVAAEKMKSMPGMPGF